ncbi:MAG: type II secretion system protein N [Gammaproteobacteria bacterium]
MSRNWLRLAILGISVFFITILMNFPAEIIAERFRENSLPGLSWQSMTGSIFNIEIDGLSIIVEQDRKLYLDRLVLQTSALPLIAGRMHIEISAQTQNSQVAGELELNFSQWHLNQINGLIKLDDLYFLFPELSLIGARGDMEISGVDLAGQYNDLPDSGNLDVQIKNMNLEIVSTKRALGNYQLTIEKIDNNQILGKVDMQDGDSQLYIMADAILNKVDKIIQVQGSAWTKMDADVQVKELLPLIGRIDNGRAQINWSTRF